MFRKRSSERLSWIACALAMTSVAMAADEPRELLERMNTALTTRNYDGTFSHWQGGKVEMLRIIHRVQGTEVRERLVSLDGSGREFIRTGTELACYLPDRRTVLVEKRQEQEQGPLLGSFPTFDSNTTGFYKIEELKRTRFNRRDTRVIAVAPKDEYRYGYRLWIDESTAMPLKTQLCDGQGRVIEQIVFSSLTLSERIPDDAFKPEVSTEGFQWLRNETGPGRQSAIASAGWSALSLPPGFRMSGRSSQVMPGSRDPVAHLVFTDGLASVSVFVESRSSKPRPPEEAQQDPAAGTASVGSSSAFSTVIDGHKVTAVGEVPPATVKFIANSVKARGTSSSSNSSPAVSAPALSPR